MRMTLAAAATLLLLTTAALPAFGQAPASAKILGFSQQSQPQRASTKREQPPGEPVQQAVMFVPEAALAGAVQPVGYGQPLAYANCAPGYGNCPPGQRYGQHHGQAGHHHGYPGGVFHGGHYGYFGGAFRTPGYPHHHHHFHREYVGPQGPPTANVAYPYYTIRGPRDFLLDNPPSIGR